MEVILNSSLCNQINDIKLGIITYHNIQVGDSPQMLRGRLQLFQESIYFDLESKNVTDIPSIQEWRTIFKKLGKDPNRYRHSAEALYRRIKKQNYLTPIHSATDLNNFFSLQYGVPLGIYDLDKINGPISITIGEAGEEYIGLNGRVNSLENLFVTKDETGPFGSPFVDSERTAVTKETTSAIQVLYLQPSLTMEEANKLTQSLMDMFVQIHGGEGAFSILQC
ncbi:DNA/RNA-binding domain of Phe-tRNA-synthetase-like protein [Bacillus pakistanensis]|uniref:DNA/RNA-binding domain of Phe-tRNA-synthetase-like protein n=1 Tax=Rossellomorea pakistanensis TaxID=992288 RepID=A0ABS2NES2_9BACI|nr:phenylalanine--tRNA ligase beta subunit-related protein [Bacillus pakistanensis]MBM7586315.1 DNA/RNA-binding domain of Phe-tRNA-synthetase-like protein [Bacillus pakistanensis]